MKIYTGTGDDGSTSLSDGSRVPKSHLRIETLGSVDELNSWLGLLRSFKENERRKNFLIYLQDQLMRCSAILAAADGTTVQKNCFPEHDCVIKIETEIDIIESKLPDLTNFIIPGGNYVVSCCQIARCVCRRAERSVVRLNSAEQTPEIVVKFLNRLSDYLFTLSRFLSLELDIQDFVWKV